MGAEEAWKPAATPAPSPAGPADGAPKSFAYTSPMLVARAVRAKSIASVREEVRRRGGEGEYEEERGRQVTEVNMGRKLKYSFNAENSKNVG